MASTFDFIIVGAGPAGCVLASRISKSATKPSVLLLEAGGNNNELADLSGDERFEVAFKPDSPLNWGYKTRQYGRDIDYSRGKGLGGSTAINFCGWTTGPSADFDEWARLVQNDAFSWQSVKKHLHSLTSVDNNVPEAFRDVIKPSFGSKDDAPIRLSYGNDWQNNLHDVFSAVVECGLSINTDVNDGDPIGMGVASVCIINGQRITSSDAFLSDAPPNLTILTNSQASKLLLENDRAVSVQTFDGRVFTARKEIILACGAIDTPKLLQLSGIGPHNLLSELDIPVLKRLEHVGENLQDHCFSTAGITIIDSHFDSKKQSPSPMGWFKIPAVFESTEFAQLPQHTQRHLQAETVPSWELVTHTPLFESIDLERDEYSFAAMAILMSPQSRGFVHIASKDPTVAPHIDPQFLQHPFDRRVMIEAVKEMLRFFRAPSWTAKTARHIGWPEDESDAAILNQIKSRLASSWHMSGTVRMGLSSDDACVDSRFSIFGIKGLRVADLSVLPFVTNNHTQSTAYVVGAIAADMIIQDHAPADI